MDGRINIDDLITHVMPLDQINTALDLMHEGKSVRSVVTFQATRPSMRFAQSSFGAALAKRGRHVRPGRRLKYA